MKKRFKSLFNKFLEKLGFKWVNSHEPHIDKKGRYVMRNRMRLLMHKKLDYMVFHSYKLPDMVEKKYRDCI